MDNNYINRNLNVYSFDTTANIVSVTHDIDSLIRNRRNSNLQDKYIDSKTFEKLKKLLHDNRFYIGQQEITSIRTLASQLALYITTSNGLSSEGQSRIVNIFNESGMENMRKLAQFSPDLEKALRGYGFTGLN